VSAKLLSGGTVSVSCPWPVSGEPPEGVQLGDGADVVVDVRARKGAALQLVPRALVLGVGCRRGVRSEQIEAVFQDFCRARGVLPESIRAAVSIDRKRDEAGLLDFCAQHDWQIRFFSADALSALEGDFSASAFVHETVGVDNVCERSAVLLSGGALFEKKYAAEGVTFALALTPPRLDWSW
jgi:cobalt-precorrin 5A hydrolase